MRTMANVGMSLLVLISYSSKLSGSPIKRERAMCFWERDGVIHFYDEDGQLYAIRPGNFIIRIGIRKVTIAEVLLENDFTRRAFSDGVVYSDVKIISHTQQT